MADPMFSRDAATALYERKLKTGAQWDCRQLLADWDEVEVQSERIARERIDLDQRLVIAQAQAADAESLATLAIEGKNEAERKARKIQVLREDPLYQDAMSLVREIERERAEMDATADALRRKARRIEKAIDYRSSALRMMGS